MTVVVRSAETMEAVHATDADFSQVLSRWFLAAGVPSTDIIEMIKNIREQLSQLPEATWLINSERGIGFVPAAGFLNAFEEVADTDVLGEVYLERTRQFEMGYTPAHDDANSSSHLVDQIESHVALIGQQSTALTDAERRKEFIQIAALAVAAVDRIDRAQNARTFSVD